MQKIMVGLSGGVDSAVAALLLKQQGYQVEGLFMKNWEEDDQAGYCAAAEDLADAQQVADQLGIPLHTVNFSAEYWQSVFEHFLDEYRAGRTPNPDVWCNREIKFKSFLEYALSLGADKIATGHYARIECKYSCRLLPAQDNRKDQTYFLYLLDQNALRHSLFPLGDYLKSEVRQLAQQAGFKNWRKKDSTGICFIGQRPFRDFLSRYIQGKPGPIVTESGQIIGEHSGLVFYTIGQRKGLGIGGLSGAQEGAWFVIDKDLKQNRLIVSQHQNLLYRHQLTASHLHWIQGQAPKDHFICYARHRHRQSLQKCQVYLKDNIAEVHFEQPQRAITPGQSIVFYQNEVLGGGIID